MAMPTPRYPYPRVYNTAPAVVWRIRNNDKYLYQLPHDFIDKYLCKIVDKIIALIRSPYYDRRLKFVAFVLDEFFVSFDTDILDFLKLHQLELIYPMVREGYIVSIERNSKHVQMPDIQPYLAVNHKVWTLGTSLEYFMRNREPLRRFSTQKCVRSLIMEHSKMRQNQPSATPTNLL